MVKLPDESVKVPSCDCKPKVTEGTVRLHRPRCRRMAAIIRKWHGREAEQRYLRTQPIEKGAG